MYAHKKEKGNKEKTSKENNKKKTCKENSKKSKEKDNKEEKEIVCQLESENERQLRKWLSFILVNICSFFFDKVSPTLNRFN